ncbi:GntR family transcriptional regulator [Jannaschia sp. M317]|uniref:GntR family transcriptional regulator n=1 Tax=Jannaschia sp. M317 TaxID=2867011 RepID=UPI0021A51CA9|nr:GntR family transcriptional regulator [Jannaschia sp. M317]UWQ19920.1 GntR family transcriptional regulator [Jannaschia sp. M317]
MSAAAQNKNDEQEDTLYEAILEDISRGVLTGGARLKVSELAARFGVSTSPIREVLRRMQGEGFVEIHANRGATVARSNAGTIQNVFELLQLMEPYFVRWFAEYASPEMIEELAQQQEAIRAKAKADIYEFRALDFDFHWTLCKYHYNTQAAETWRRLRTALNVHAALLRITPPRMQAILREHDELIAACRDNDADRADRAIRAHVDGSFVQMSQQMRALRIDG